MAKREHGIASRTLRGMAWAYGSYVGGRLLVLLATAILARLLTPSEFGLVAFALTVTAFLDIVSDLGVSQTLIVLSDEEAKKKANTAWTLGVLLGGLLTLGDGGRQPARSGLLPSAGADADAPGPRAQLLHPRLRE